MNEKENLHYELTISVFKESFFMISERIIYTNILDQEITITFYGLEVHLQ